jgi:GNAT superfamily N-acetyltransferase
MAYEINITQVGPDEYPLIRVLWETVCTTLASQERPDIEPGLCDAGIQLLAHLEGNPLGLMVALPQDSVIRVLGCGVMKEYRRQGIGGRILEWIEKQADAKKSTVEMAVPTSCVEMEAFLQKRAYRHKWDKWYRAPRPIDSSK